MQVMVKIGGKSVMAIAKIQFYNGLFVLSVLVNTVLLFTIQKAIFSIVIIVLFLMKIIWLFDFIFVFYLIFSALCFLPETDDLNFDVRVSYIGFLSLGVMMIFGFLGLHKKQSLN